MYENGVFFELDESELLAHPEEWDWHDGGIEGKQEYIYCTNADWTINGDDPRNDWATVMYEEDCWNAWHTSVDNMMVYGEGKFANLDDAIGYVEETIDMGLY